METSTTPLGRFLTEARKARGLTQVQAAARIGCTVPDLSRYENGLTPKLERALVMCKVYGKSANQMAQAMGVAVEE